MRNEAFSHVLTRSFGSALECVWGLGGERLGLVGGGSVREVRRYGIDCTLGMVRSDFLFI
jgi:hypothetical protein